MISEKMFLKQVEVIDSFGTTPPARLVRGDDFSRHIYRLAVFDGVRSYGGGVATGGVQVCGIIPCLNDSMSSCGLRADSSDASPTYFVGNLYKISTTFNYITISSSFFYNNTFIFPSVLVTGENDEFGQLLAQDDVKFERYDPFNQSSICGMSINKSISSLVTAAVYARQFDKDGEPRTVRSNANQIVILHKLLIIVAIAIHLQIF